MKNKKESITNVTDSLVTQENLTTKTTTKQVKKTVQLLLFCDPILLLQAEKEVHNV